MTQTVAAHTPGPWKAQRDIRHQLNTGTLTDDSPKAWAVYGQSKRVACISETLGVDWDKDTQAEANAHLIAAAPELLAALEYVASVLNMTDPEHEDFADSGADTVQALCEGEARIRAAIAKAKGGAA